MTTYKVLLVDDAESFTKLAKLALEDSGEFEVRVENNALEAQRTIRLFKPDIIVLDVLMPGLSGLEVGTLIKKDPDLKQLPIVFLTAAVSRENPYLHHELLEACPVLVKPVGVDELADALRKILKA